MWGPSQGLAKGKREQCVLSKCFVASTKLPCKACVEQGLEICHPQSHEGH